MSELEQTSASSDEKRRSSGWLHLGLFAITAAVIVWWWTPDWVGGVQYAAGLLAILLAHEFGHYFAARHYGIDVSLPYFVPGVPPLYTFGAFIKMQATTMDRSALLTIGAAGPLAGAAVAIPVYIIGVALSEPIMVPELMHPEELMIFGDSLLSWLVIRLWWGPLPEGVDIIMHPLAYAGWVGFFVTALNLIPIGQLDGGHVGFAVFGRRYYPAASVLYVLLVLFGVFIHPAWLVLSIFLILTGVRHPPITKRGALPTWAKVVGAASLLLFVLTFVPQPIALPTLPELLSQVWP